MGNGKRRLLALALALFGTVLFSGEIRAGGDPCSTELTNASSQFWVPLIGHGTDPFGNRFDTVFKVINLQETPASFTILTCSDTGETAPLLAGPGGGGPPVSTMQVSVAGRGTVTINSLNSSPQTRLDTGWATISTPSAIGVEVIFNLRTDAGFLTSTNVRVGILTQSTSFFADIGPSVNTGVAFLYPPQADSGAMTAPDRVEADLLLRDDSGAVVARSSIALNKAERRSLFLGELLNPAGSAAPGFAKGASAFSGTVEIRLTRAGDPNALERWAILPIRQEGLVLTTQIAFPPRLSSEPAATRSIAAGPSQPAGFTLCTTDLPDNGTNRVFYVALAGHGTDAAGNRLDTVFKIINFDSETASARIIGCGADGQPLEILRSEGPGPTRAVSLIDFTVAGDGSRTLQSLNADPENRLDSGWVAVVSEDFVGVEVIFNLEDSQGSPTSTNVQIFPIVTAVSFFADIGPAVNTGVAFLFPVASDATPQRAGVDLFLLNDEGVIVAQTEIGLDRGETTARFLGELLTPSGDTVGEFLKGASESFSGSVEIRASEPVSVLPLRQEGLVLTTQALFPPRVIR